MDNQRVLWMALIGLVLVLVVGGVTSAAPLADSVNWWTVDGGGGSAAAVVTACAAAPAKSPPTP